MFTVAIRYVSWDRAKELLTAITLHTQIECQGKGLARSKRFHSPEYADYERRDVDGKRHFDRKTVRLAAYSIRRIQRVMKKYNALTVHRAKLSTRRVTTPSITQRKR